MRYFKKHEFDCHCNYDCGLGFSDIQYELIEKLDSARELAGIPFMLNSVVRCERHNADVGGRENSAHLFGEAVDIACASSAHRLIMLRALLDVGFNRLGVYSTFIHADVNKHLPQNVIWHGK